MTEPRAHLERWKQSLLDPTDRLLDLADDGIPIDVDPVRVAFALASGASFGFAAVTSLETGRLGAALPPIELGRRLGLVRRAARDAAAEGQDVTWLALGLLAWRDRAGAPRIAPLALWPVVLDHDRIVAATGREPRVNAALLEALRRDHELVLGAPHDELDLAALFDRATEAAVTRPGWRVERTARLATCSFARFDLWRDLAGRGDELLATGPIAWLAGAAEPPDLPAAGGDVLAPLDADASQLAAIAAAGAGGSFVLHGAPGTGKSQTIANLVVHCVSRGKTVLVVSDRASALDVVHHRLAAIGLGEFCLPLHAGHDDRARVLGALSRVLDRAFRPGAGPSSFDARIAELRATLDGHVAAMHNVDQLGMSMHDVLGRLVELRTTPCAALADGDAVGLGRVTFERRKRAVTALAEAALPLDPVATHPWRTSALAEWSEDGTDRAQRALERAAEAVDGLVAAVAEITPLVPRLVARTPDQLRALGALAELVAGTPRPGAELLTNMRASRTDDVYERVALIRARGGGTIEVPRDPAAFLAVAARHRALVAEIEDRFTQAVADIDAPGLWTQLKRWTHSMAPVRFVALRTARAQVRAAAMPGAFDTDEAMVTALEAVIAERACRSALLAAAEPARRWFGELGPRAEAGGGAADVLALDLDRIDGAVAWGVELRRAFDQIAIAGGEAGRQAAWRALVAQVAAAPSADALSAFTDRSDAAFARLAAAVLRWQPAVAELAAATGIAPAAFGAGPDHLASLRDQLEMLQDALGSLDGWARFHLARRAAYAAGIGHAIAAIERGDLGAGELAGAWERATLVAWLEAMPALAHFEGAAHHSQVTTFSDLDRGSLALARARAVAGIAERVPRATAGDPEVAALRRELERGRSLRTSLAELPTLLPRLAPCMLATPHAVAQHLDASLPAFDLVVFDEASRLAVAHALPALARAKSVIVVGDPRQPAPADGGDSLLDVAVTAELPELALVAHYRSRHEDLFAFANRRYYGDRIELLPAAQHSAELGISWRQIDGDTDLLGANRAEADAIIAELASRLRDPARRSRSLAVVALSCAQRDAIEDALELARATDPELDAALAAAAGDALLIGTPDRVQGEERDVVLVSIGERADALGVLAHPGAARWLDVAITRAREQLILVSSFAPEDIPLDAASATRDLAAVLAFARAGGGAGRPPDDAEPASPITAAIARALVERGWIVRHRVGCGAYRIDLAVVDPSDPERYVLAIEHDGAAYASAAGARDRDRLRAQVLGQLGWRLHRIWALDWWRDAEREIHRVHGAIVAAIAAGRQRRAPVTPRPARKRIAAGSAPHAPIASAQAEQAASAPIATGSGPTDAATALRLPRGAIGIGPYTAAAIPAGRRVPDDMFSPRHLGELNKIVEQVLAAEAPIHVDLLARRVGAYFGVGRVTQRIADQVRVALAGRGRWGDEQGVVWRIDQDPACVPAVRVAGNAPSARREIGEVPLSELAAAARIVVERAHAVSTADLVRDCARLLGFARITDRVAERVTLGVQLAAQRALIAIDDGKARLP